MGVVIHHDYPQMVHGVQVAGAHHAGRAVLRMMGAGGGGSTGDNTATGMQQQQQRHGDNASAGATQTGAGSVLPSARWVGDATQQQRATGRAGGGLSLPRPRTGGVAPALQSDAAFGRP